MVLQNSDGEYYLDMYSVKHSLAYIEDTKEKINFNPVCNLEDGIKETVQYFLICYNNEKVFVVFTDGIFSIEIESSKI